MDFIGRGRERENKGTMMSGNRILGKSINQTPIQIKSMKSKTIYMENNCHKEIMIGTKWGTVQGKGNHGPNLPNVAGSLRKTLISFGK